MVRLYITSSGIATATIGATALIGYLLEIPKLYNWNDGKTMMAVNTAVALVLCGVAIAVIGGSHRLWRTGD